MALDLSHARWIKSTRSSGGQNCVEATGDLPGVVAVRDSKHPELGALVLGPDSWRSFVARLKQ